MLAVVYCRNRLCKFKWENFTFLRYSIPLHLKMDKTRYTHNIRIGCRVARNGNKIDPVYWDCMCSCSCILRHSHSFVYEHLHASFFKITWHLFVLKFSALAPTFDCKNPDGCLKIIIQKGTEFTLCVCIYTRVWCFRIFWLFISSCNL